MATALLLQTWVDDEFTPSNGQVSFIISQSTTDPASVRFLVNGVDYDQGDDFTVSGTTATWLNPFTLKTLDKVLIRYQ